MLSLHAPRVRNARARPFPKYARPLVELIDVRRLQSCAIPRGKSRRRLAVENCGMDVTPAADRRRVTQMLSDLLYSDAVLPVFYGGSGWSRGWLEKAQSAAVLGIKQFKLLQRQGREISGGPGAKILRGNLLAANFTQVAIDVSRVDRMLAALRRCIGTARNGKLRQPLIIPASRAMVDIYLITESLVSAKA